MNEKTNSYLVTGLVHKVGEVVNVSDSFKKRQLVILTEDRYPQYLNTQLVQDKVNLLDNLKKGDKVELNINLRGREWPDPKTGENKYFNTLDVWTLKVISESSNEPTDLNTAVEGPTDLPF